MAAVQATDPYDGEEKISNWFQRFESFLELNEVETAKKMQWLVHAGGKIIFEKLDVICRPKKPKDCSYELVKPKLLAMLEPTIDVGLARLKFYMAFQDQSETVSDYALRLKELCNGCNFASGTAEIIIRDRFIYSLNVEQIRSQVIKSKCDDTFENAVSDAQMHECNRSQTDSLARFGAKQRLGPPVRDRYSDQSRSREAYVRENCKRCGRRGGHDPGFICIVVKKKLSCSDCGTPGHLSTVCPRRLDRGNQRNRNGGSENPNKKKRYDRNAEVRSDSEDNEESEGEESDFKTLRMGTGEYRFNTFETSDYVRPSTKPPCTKSFVVNGKEIECELDCGACITVFTKGHLDQYFRDVEMKPIRSKKIRNADGRVCDISGAVELNVNGKFDLQAVILNSHWEELARCYGAKMEGVFSAGNQHCTIEFRC